MNKNAIRKEIAELIDSIKHHSDEIGTQKRIPQIELELILSKIKKLYEKSIVFNYLNSLEEESFNATPSQSKSAEPTLIRPAEPASVPDIVDVIPKNERFIEAVIPPSVPSEPIASPQQPPAPQPSAPPQPAGKDLKTMIGLNDKILFTKELFGNDPSQYSAAIERLNTTRDKNELENQLKQLNSERGWQQDNKAVISFRTIAERRF